VCVCVHVNINMQFNWWARVLNVWKNIYYMYILYILTREPHKKVIIPSGLAER